MSLLWEKTFDRLSSPHTLLDSFESRGVMSLTKEPTPHILLVDDDVAIRQCVRQFLEIQGYRCTEADNGLLALRELRKDSFSLIITDNQMPLLDGISFLEIHHGEHVNNPTPVIIVTGHVSSSLRSRAKQIGVNNIFQKPCNFEDLSATITKLI